MTLTHLDLDRIEGLAKAATPGPWKNQGATEEGEAFIIGANLGGLVAGSLPWPTELDSGDFSRVEIGSFASPSVKP